MNTITITTKSQILELCKTEILIRGKILSLLSLAQRKSHDAGIHKARLNPEIEREQLDANALKSCKKVINSFSKGRLQYELTERLPIELITTPLDHLNFKLST